MKKQLFMLLILSVILITSCATMKSSYEKAVENNSIEVYKHYLEKYPESEFSNEVKSKLVSLEFEKAKNLNTLDSYKHFLVTYKDNVYTEKVENNLDELEFNRAKKLNTVDGYNYFIKEYPHSKYLDQVNLILEKKRYEHDLEMNFYKEVKLLSNIEERLKFIDERQKSEYIIKPYFYDMISETEDLLVKQIEWENQSSWFCIKDIRPYNTKEISGKCIISGYGTLTERTKLRKRSPNEIIEVDYIGPKEKDSEILKMSNTMIMTFHATNKYDECIEGTRAFFNEGALWKKVAIAIESGKFEKGWTVSFEDIFVSALCSTDKNIAIEPIISGGKYYLCPAGTHGSIHRLIGEIKIGNYAFIGEIDPIFPLTFLLHKDYGYIYLRGKGSVVLPSGKIIRFSDKHDKEWLTKANAMIEPYSSNVSEDIKIEEIIETNRTPGFTPKFVMFDDPPFPIQKVSPEYTDEYKGTNIEGEVWLEVEVLDDGTVGAVEVKESLDSSPGGFDEAAINAVKQWEFYPAKNNGKPVACWITYPITFSLPKE